MEYPDLWGTPCVNLIRVALTKLDIKATLWNMISVIENQVSEVTSGRIE